MKKLFAIIQFVILIMFTSCTSKEIQKSYPHKIGDAIDSLNGVKVFYNAETDNVSGYNQTEDKYNIGLKYQCVEFVKRYYLEYLNHRMPNAYGNAKDFFNTSLQDGEINTDRNLVQYTNPSKTKPQVSDLIVFTGTEANIYGHVAIISNVSDNEVEIIQQNAGPFDAPRDKFKLQLKDGKWKIEKDRILGWLRKE